MYENRYNFTKDSKCILKINNDNEILIHDFLIKNIENEKYGLSQFLLKNEISILTNHDNPFYEHNRKIFSNKNNYKDLSTFFEMKTKYLWHPKTLKDIGCNDNAYMWWEQDKKTKKSICFIYHIVSKEILAFELTDDNYKLYKNNKNKKTEDFIDEETEIKDIENKIKEDLQFATPQEYKENYQKVKYNVSNTSNDKCNINVYTKYKGNPKRITTYLTPINKKNINGYNITYYKEIYNLYYLLMFKSNCKDSTISTSLKKYFYSFSQVCKSFKKNNKNIHYSMNYKEIVYIENKPILLFRKFSGYLNKPVNNKLSIIETNRTYVDPFTKKCYVHFYKNDYIFEWKQFNYQRFMNKKEYAFYFIQDCLKNNIIYNFLTNPYYNVYISSINSYDNGIELFFSNSNCYYFNNHKYNIIPSINTQKYINKRKNLMQLKLNKKLLSFSFKIMQKNISYFERVDKKTVVFRFFKFDYLVGLKEYFNIFIDNKIQCFFVIDDLLVSYKGSDKFLFDAYLINKIDNLENTCLNIINHKMIHHLNNEIFNKSLFPYFCICYKQSQIIEQLIKTDYWKVFSTVFINYNLNNFFSRYGPTFLYIEENYLDKWLQKDLNFNPIFSKNKYFHYNVFQLHNSFISNKLANQNIKQLLNFPLKKLSPVKNEIISVEKLFDYTIFANLLKINNADDKRVYKLKYSQPYVELRTILYSKYWKNAFDNDVAKINTFLNKMLLHCHFEEFPVQYQDCMNMYKKLNKNHESNNLTIFEFNKNKLKFLNNMIKMDINRFERLHRELINNIDNLNSQNNSNKRRTNKKLNLDVLMEKEYLFYEYKDEKFSIIAPKNYDEIVFEGKELHHCVGMYKDDVSNKKTKIYFLRNNDFLDIPFITLEVKNQQLNQAYAYKDTMIVNDEVKNFIKKWCKIKSLSNYNYWISANLNN